MNAPLRVAQLGSGAGTTPPRVVKVTKPGDGQAITIELSYTQSVKLDLSAVASEQITLVHVGEKLIILFDNRSTVTVEPFFDSMGVPLANVNVQVTGDRDVTGFEFANLFPITTDQSVLPAAGEGTGPLAGANFRSPVIDPLLSPDPLPLLPQEELPGFAVTFAPGVLPLDEVGEAGEPPLQQSDGSVSGIVEEEQFAINLELIDSEAGNGNEDILSNPDLDQDTSIVSPGSDITTLHSEGELATLISGGAPPFSFSIFDVTADGDPDNNFVRDTGGNIVKSLGDDVHYEFINANTIEGRASDGRLIFTLTLAVDGHYEFDLNDTIDHPTASIDDGTDPVGALEETLFLNLTGLVQVSDSGGNTITLTGTAFTIGVIDDTPIAALGQGESAEVSVDETIANSLFDAGDNADDEFLQSDPFGIGDLIGFAQIPAGTLFVNTSLYGADIPGSTGYGLILNPGASGLFSGLYDAVTGEAIVLSLDGGGNVVGKVEGTNDVVFVIGIDPNTGEVTVAQYRAIQHGLSGDFGSLEQDEAGTPEPMDAGLVQVQVSVTDFDEDVATAVGELGSLIKFEDDGISVEVDHNTIPDTETPVPPPTLGLDESIGPDGSDANADSDVNPPVVEPSLILGLAFDPVTDPAKAIGIVHTPAGDGPGSIANLFTIDLTVGTDGENFDVHTELYSLVLNGPGGLPVAEGVGVATTLVVTDLDGTAVVGDDPALDLLSDAGRTIWLFQQADGSILGKIGQNTLGDADDDYVALRIVIDENSGVLTVEQYLPIEHGVFPNSFDEAALLTFPAGQGSQASLQVMLAAYVEDNDGDFSTGSATVTLASTNPEVSSIVFDDDGPTAAISAPDGAAVIHDETAGVDAGSNDQAGPVPFTAPVGAGSLIGWAGALGFVSTAGSSFGTDGPGTKVLGLDVSLPGGVDSLLDTTNGRSIFLFLELGLIVGREGTAGDTPDLNGAVAFAIGLDPNTGDLGVAQYLAIKHPNTADADEAAAPRTLGAGVAFAKVTVTDGDSDAATQLLDLSGKIKFEDDGPNADAITVTPASIIHDETAGVQNDEPGNGVGDDPDAPGDLVVEHDVVGPLTVFTDWTGAGEVLQTAGAAIGWAQNASGVAIGGLPGAYGTDGAGTTALALTTSGGGAFGDTPTSLFDNVTGFRIFLYTDAPSGLVVGRVGTGTGVGDFAAAGAIAFALAIAGNDAVSLVQYRSIEHPTPGASNDESVDLLTPQLTGLLFVTAKVTDGDGDFVTKTSAAPLTVTFEDDGPSVNVSPSTVSATIQLALGLDETVQPDGGNAPAFDLANPPEPNDANGGVDDVDVPPGAPFDYNDVPVVETNPAADEAIGSRTTSGGLIDDLFLGLAPNFGADGPAAGGGVTHKLSFVLSSTVVGTNLVATALDGTALETMTTAQRTIELFKVSDTEVVGRVVGDSPDVNLDDKFVAFRITLNDTGDPATSTITVDQFLPIDHDASEDAGSQGAENPSLFDEQQLLKLIGLGTFGLQLETTATDGDGDQFTDSATVDLANSATSFISFDDDGPDVNLLGAPAIVVEGDTVSGTWNHDFGTDGFKSLTITVAAAGQTSEVVTDFAGFVSESVVHTPGGTFTVEADGDWSFAASPVNADTSVTISLTLSDGDNDTDVASATFTVENDDVPAITSTDGFVNEAALSAAANGGDPGTSEAADGFPNDNDDPTETATGTFNINTGGDVLDQLFINGQAINITGGNATTNVTGLYGTLTVTDVGAAGGAFDWSYTLGGNTLTHPLINQTGVNDIRLDEFQIEAIDDDGSSSADDLFQSNEIITIDVRDDGPLAFNNTAEASPNQAGAQIDLLLVVDTSGSMFDNTVAGVADNFGFGDRRIDLARLALLDLVNQANVDEVKFVKFGSTATTTVWMTKAAAITYILDASNFPDLGATDYDAALALAKTAFSTPPADTDQRLVHFLSDGEPNEDDGTGSDGISEADTNNAGFGGLGEETHWINFLTANNVVKSSAFGIGGLTAGNANNLEPIAWQSPEAAGTFTTAVQDANVKIISDDNISGLGSTLVSAVPGSQTGNLLNDQVPDSFGADGGRILSIQIGIGGITYTWDGASTITPSSGPAIPPGSSLTNVPTPQGGTLTFDFTNGVWTYTTPATVTNATPDEVFTYKLVDGDGDQSAPATLTIDLVPVGNAPVILTPPGGLMHYWTTDTTDTDQTFINRVAFSDTDATTVRVTFTSANAGDNFSATSGAGVTVDDSGAINTIVLDGTIIDINAFLAANKVGWNPAGAGSLANNQVDRTLTVTIDDNGGVAGGNIISKNLLLDHSTVTFDGNANNVDFAPWNLNQGGPQARRVDADVQAGDTGGVNNNQFGFTYTSAAVGGLSITQISIDVTGIGVFDQAGGSSKAFTIGAGSTVLLGDVSTVTSGDTTNLVITFAPGAFIVGEVLRFGIDTDTGSATLVTGGDFGDEDVPFAVTFSDGTTLNSTFADGPGSGASDTSVGVVELLDTGLISTLGGNDVGVTSWSHGPSTQDVAYNGGGSGSDSITLVFTPAQLEAILSDTSVGGAESRLQAYLDGAVGTGDTLNLGDTSWNATVTGFGQAHLAVASGLTDYVVYGSIDTGGTDANLPDLLAGITGDGNDNTLVGTAGVDTIAGNGGNDILVGLGADDTLNGGALNDLLLGGAGNDTLSGGTGSDIMFGGSGSDRFAFAAGDSGQAATTMDIIGDYLKGAVGVGDVIDYGATPLTIGGSAAAATAAQASIDASTGVATFAPGSGTTLADALADIATSINVGGTTAGEFALFQVNGTGDYHIFISDGINGVGANDVVARLFGVGTIGSVNVASGDLTITS